MRQSKVVHVHSTYLTLHCGVQGCFSSHLRTLKLFKAHKQVTHVSESLACMCAVLGIHFLKVLYILAKGIGFLDVMMIVDFMSICIFHS